MLIQIITDHFLKDVLFLTTTTCRDGANINLSKLLCKLFVGWRSRRGDYCLCFLYINKVGRRSNANTDIYDGTGGAWASI